MASPGWPSASLRSRPYLDFVVHRRLPWLFTGQVERIVHRLRADTEELFYNVSYVLVLFGLLLMFLFLGTGG